MIVSDEMIRGNDILVEIENLNHEYHLINERMVGVYKNSEAMRGLLEKSREIRQQVEVLESELKTLMID